MKIFICGQRSFGRAVLKRLYEDGHEIVGVAPPPQGRLKDKMVGFAILHGIPVVSDCDRLVSGDIPGGTDLVISAHSHWMISDKVLGKCRYGGIGFHPSLLPRHRGQDAVRWTAHMGDPITGGTIYRLDSRCDGGDILMREVLFVEPGWDYHDIWRELFPIGVRMISEAVSRISSGDTDWRPQNESVATWEPSWERPRLKRNELIMIGGAPPECSGCLRECETCTYHIADPGQYGR